LNCVGLVAQLVQHCLERQWSRIWVHLKSFA